MYTKGILLFGACVFFSLAFCFFKKGMRNRMLLWHRNLYILSPVSNRHRQINKCENLQTNRRINFERFSKYLFGGPLNLPMCKPAECGKSQYGACRRHCNHSLTMSDAITPSNKSAQHRHCLPNGFGYMNRNIRTDHCVNEMK